MKFLFTTFLLCLLSFSFSQNDLKLDSVFHRTNVGEYYSNGLEYHQMPINQLRPIEFSALVTNSGANDLTNCYLQIDVMSGASTILSVHSDSVLIPSLSQDSLFGTSSIDLNGQNIGLYSFIVSVNSDSAEVDFQNNVDTILFEITNNMLSRSDFEIVDSTKNYYHDSLDYRSFGYVFKVESDACLSAVYPWFTLNPANADPSSGGVYATLFELDTINKVFDPLTLNGVQTQPNTANELGAPFKIPFNSSSHPQTLLTAGGTYLVTVNSPSNFHEFYLSQKTIDSTVYRAFSFGGPGSAYYLNEVILDARMIMMDIEFDNASFCNLNFEEDKQLDVIVYPIPFNSYLTIEGVENEADYQILNFQGQIVKSGVVVNQGLFGLDTLPSGSYLLRIESSDGILIKKIVK